jgi:hypothetical protein
MQPWFILAQHKRSWKINTLTFISFHPSVSIQGFSLAKPHPNPESMRHDTALRSHVPGIIAA